jgi:2-iminobutanoate/2-iminopropanoate deaminase
VTKQGIFSDKLAKAVGPFSPGVRSDGFIYVSGHVGQDPSTGKVVAGGVEQQTQQVFANLRAVLDAAGKSFDDVIRAGVYLTDMGNFASMNTIFARHFTEPYPARTTIAVAALPLGAAVEIDLVVRG